MRKLVWIAFALLALSAASCYVTGRAAVPTVHATVAAPPPPTVHATVSAPPPATVVGTVSAPPAATVVGQVSMRPTVTGVTVLTQSCTPGAPEMLNGIDDNCNGLIDEGFVGTGTLQITLGWDTPADLDLYVVDPSGTEISYQQERSQTGGFLDRDARGACTDGEVGENVFWQNNPPGGHYVVRVNYYSSCDRAGPTTFVVSVSYNNEIVGAYQYTIAEDQTVEVFGFDL